MNEKILMELLAFYVGISVSDLLIKIIVLNHLYNKAKKEAPKLLYKDNMVLENLKILFDVRLVQFYTIFNTSFSSFVPGYGQYTTKNILDRKDDFYNAYKELFNIRYNEINEIEEYDREGVAMFLKKLHDSEDFREAIGDEYKGHKFEDETIRISRKEMIKFLKKKRIVLEEISTDGEYTDYNVKLLNK